jgi:hypothetical protein
MTTQTIPRDVARDGVEKLNGERQHAELAALADPKHAAAWNEIAALLAEIVAVLQDSAIKS